MQGTRTDSLRRASAGRHFPRKNWLIAACLGLGLASGCGRLHEATSDESRVGPDRDARAATDPPLGGAPSDGSCPGLPAAVRARWIAFDSDRGESEGRDLYMRRADGSELTRLTQRLGEEREPAFSPDGTRLAFVSEYDGVAIIYVYDFRSGEVRQATRWPERVGNANWFARGPAWFPDGTKLAFDRGGELLVIDVDSSGSERSLAVGVDYVEGYKNAAVTPDGREIVCDDHQSEIVAINVQNGARRRIARERAVTIEAPSVSPDGKRVAYSTVCNENFLQIGLAPISGEPAKPCKITLITPADGSRNLNAAWGPGEYIAYQSDPDEGDYASSIALVKPGEPRCVFDRDGAHEANPAWAPEGFELPADFAPF